MEVLGTFPIDRLEKKSKNEKIKVLGTFTLGTLEKLLKIEIGKF